MDSFHFKANYEVNRTRRMNIAILVKCDSEKAEKLSNQDIFQNFEHEGVNQRTSFFPIT